MHEVVPQAAAEDVEELKRAIAKMADMVENGLRLQFARLNYDAVR